MFGSCQANEWFIAVLGVTQLSVQQIVAAELLDGMACDHVAALCEHIAAVWLAKCCDVDAGHARL